MIESAKSIKFVSLKWKFMEAIDLGLSVKWASCNIGASNPFECGDFFAFGETESKDIFSKVNYSANIMIGDFINEGGIKQLLPQNDVAQIRYGNKWRVPTRFEIEELIEKCSYDISKINGVYGTQVWSNNGNSVFIPNTGRKIDDKVLDERRLYYWLSTIRVDANQVNNSDVADGFGGDRGWIRCYFSYSVYVGRCIRPVMDY